MTMQTKKTVEFYFDVGSPAAYLAWTQLPRLCADAGAELVWKPILLGGVFQAIGAAEHDKNTTILIKGSRSAVMENVVVALCGSSTEKH